MEIEYLLGLRSVSHCLVSGFVLVAAHTNEKLREYRLARFGQFSKLEGAALKALQKKLVSLWVLISPRDGGNILQMLTFVTCRSARFFYENEKTVLESRRDTDLVH